MASAYIVGNKSTTNVTAVNMTDNEQVLIAATGSVVSTGYIGIQATGSNNTINVFGTVFGGGNAIQMGTLFSDHDNRIFVGETGYINGSASNGCIYIRSMSAVIDNDGTLWNKNTLGFGIVLNTSNSAHGSQVINTGVIDVFSKAISSIGNDDVHIENSGLIRGATAISGGIGEIAVQNSGKIIGEIVFGQDDDTFDTRTGTYVGTLHAGEGDDAIYGSKGNDTFLGEAGNDRLYGYNGNDFLDAGAGIDTVMGGNGDDTLFGNSEADNLDGEAGNDLIDGGTGADMIYGGLGVDKLSGGADADRFIFRAKETGATKITADTITDFQSDDDIDLGAIDANTKHAGDDTFSFIGTQAFHGKAGELRYQASSTETWIYGDTNGDKKIDLVIHLDDPIALSKDHFIL